MLTLPIGRDSYNIVTQSTAQKQAGFTLVEVMTVLVIIGLMSSAVLLTMRAPESSVTTQAQTLLRNVNIMAQETLISGQPSAMGVSRDGVTLYAFEDGEWQARQSQNWVDAMTVILEKEATRLKLTEEIVPTIIFEPTGLSSPFSLTLTGSDHVYTLSSIGDGRVVIEARS